MNVEEIAKILAVADELDELKPSVVRIIQHVASYGPELSDFLEKMSFGLVDIKMKTIKRYEDGGFTRQEAIILTLSDIKGAMEAMKNNKK